MGEALVCNWQCPSERHVLDKNIRSTRNCLKAVHAFKVLSDEWMRDHLVITTRHPVEYGFRVVHGYTQDDEVSLVLHLSDDLFCRKLRKYTLVLAGEASVASPLFSGVAGPLDCRNSQLPCR